MSIDATGAGTVPRCHQRARAVPGEITVRMDDTPTVRDGARRDLTATFVSRRTLECEGELVRRLLVSTAGGDRIALFVPPGADPLPDLATGAAYRFDGVLGCEPAGAEGSGDDGQTIDAFPAVARAVERLAIDDPFGILDERVDVRDGGDGPAERD